MRDVEPAKLWCEDPLSSLKSTSRRRCHVANDDPRSPVVPCLALITIASEVSRRWRHSPMPPPNSPAVGGGSPPGSLWRSATSPIILGRNPKGSRTCEESSRRTIIVDVVSTRAWPPEAQRREHQPPKPSRAHSHPPVKGTTRTVHSGAGLKKEACPDL